MARFSDLPAEIMQQILDEFRPTYSDDSQTIQLARVHIHWADMLYKSFRQKYDFLEEQFIRETWAYLTMTEASFMTTMGRPYAQNLPSKRSSMDYCMIWINDFKIQRERIAGADVSVAKDEDSEPSSNTQVTHPVVGVWPRVLAWMRRCRNRLRT